MPLIIRYYWTFMIEPDEETRTPFNFYRNYGVDPAEPGDDGFKEVVRQSLDNKLLPIRLLVGYVRDGDRLAQLMRATRMGQGQEGCYGMTWVEEVMKRIWADGGTVLHNTRAVSWSKIQETAMRFCELKEKQLLNDGKSNYDTGKPPTYDMIKQTEVIG
ncbi:hypothetical protein KEM55_005815 [Ascosphaera atra]|nr:hypothetical protein KEM55_005815 [Ascosphaera atra]